MARKKRADQVRQLYNLANSWTRKQWENVNQQSYEFAHDEQISAEEKTQLEEQGMPTFTINRILPVVEMLNFYATANNPRWQAIGVEGSDTDVASVVSDLADYVWSNSNGSTLYNNAINDAVTKGIGYLLVSVDKDADNGMGEVVVQQPEPFDLYVDPKSRDMLFKDASFIMIRKVLPKNHLMQLFPDQKRKISSANSDENMQTSYSYRNTGDHDQKLFAYNDNNEQSSMAINADGSEDQLVEFFEVYEKIKISYINVFYRIPPSKEELASIKQQCDVMVQEMQAEMQVELMEQDKKMQEAVQKGEMLPERYQLEMKKAQDMSQKQLQAYYQECMSKLQSAQSRIENSIVSEKEFNILSKEESFAKNIVDSIQFYNTRIKQTCIAGDKLLYEYVLPDTVKEYPVVPFHYKWTGTPYPMSAVAPLVGKQQEINKAHQIMVHNASLGSSLRWMYEEGSVDTEMWEKYSSSPGALLPIRPGVTPPTAIQPAPLSSAFFQIVNEGKNDMEYLAGIYGSMMGDSRGASETYRGMLALDEYGTRRIKQWMNTCIEPALKQLGEIVLQFSQATYTAHKRFRIIQPSAIQEGKTQEVNIPIYNDMGEAIGKSMDVSSMKFDVRVVSGSTLPVNRWAYLEELKQLMQLGVVDDIAVLAETDLKNKEKIVKRKSLYSQLQGQLQGLQEALKDKDGTIETLERQLVQAGIKGKVMQAEVEINKKKEEVKSAMNKEFIETEGKQKLLRNVMSNNAEHQQQQMNNSASLEEERMSDFYDNIKKDLESSSKDE
tara:strand:+ start:7707 stop:10043 length:2337 start_codon:yes stop_codon:yes gene_type:complete